MAQGRMIAMQNEGMKMCNEQARAKHTAEEGQGEHPGSVMYTELDLKVEVARFPCRLPCLLHAVLCRLVTQLVKICEKRTVREDKVQRQFPKWHHLSPRGCGSVPNGKQNTHSGKES